MKDQMNVDRLGELFAEIEQAWLDRGDCTIVYRLSDQHPEFREFLYEFFEDLVLGPEESPDSAKVVEAEDRLQQWLESTGFDIARQVAAQPGASSTTTVGSEGGASPAAWKAESKDDLNQDRASEVKPLGPSHTTNLLLFLRERTKLKIQMIAASLTNVTTEYLILISRHPNIVPAVVKKTLATNIEQVWGIAPSDSIQYLDKAPNVVRAASRSRPFTREPQTFEELLDRSELNQEQRSFWVHLQH
jgi:hypothetical protein